MKNQLVWHSSFQVIDILVQTNAVAQQQSAGIRFAEKHEMALGNMCRQLRCVWKGIAAGSYEYAALALMSL